MCRNTLQCTCRCTTMYASDVHCEPCVYTLGYTYTYIGVHTLVHCVTFRVTQCIQLHVSQCTCRCYLMYLSIYIVYVHGMCIYIVHVHGTCIYIVYVISNWAVFQYFQDLKLYQNEFICSISKFRGLQNGSFSNIFRIPWYRNELNGNTLILSSFK